VARLVPRYRKRGHTTYEAICERLSELLRAPVAVVDEHECIIAGRAWRRPHLRIALRIAGQSGEVIMAEPGGDAISPHLAQGLVELAVSEASALAQLPDQVALKDLFIHDLLHGLNDEEHIERQARILGLEFGPPRRPPRRRNLLSLAAAHVALPR
jgi:carbohydrate diacid regulator